MLVTFAQIRQPFTIADVPEALPIEAAVIRNPILRDLRYRWQAAVGQDRLPPRAAFTPESLRGALGRVMILQVESGPGATSVFRYRLFGTDMCDFHGRDMTGLTTDDFDCLDFAKATRRQNEAALERGGPSCFVVCIGNGEVRYQYEKLILPVAVDDGGTQLIVCSFPLD